MKTTTSLAFTSDGLINPGALDFFISKQMDELVVFSDGSTAAFDHLCNFDYSPYVTDIRRLRVGRLPMFDIRVVNIDGTVSLPNYVFSDRNRIDWFCMNICAPCISINASDITSKSDTKVALSKHQVALICDMAHSFWAMLRVVEDHLCFPAMAIDGLVRWSRILTPDTIDIPALRIETGMQSLEYNRLTDQISVTVGQEIFSTKLGLLNDFFKNTILPFFNRHRGRRYRLEVSVLGLDKNLKDPRTMSYGQLGQLVTQMHSLVQYRYVDTQNPIAPDDLLLFSRKVKIDEESCLSGTPDQTIKDFLVSCRDHLIREPLRPSGPNLFEEVERQAQTDLSSPTP